MNYKDQVAPELKKYAKSMPFNRQIVSVGNVYQAAAYKLTKIPGDISAETMEIEGYWHKGTVPIWAMIIPSNYGRWWKKSFKAAREYGWDWYRLWNEYNDLITGEDRGIIMAHFDETIKDKYEKVTKRFSDDLKINYIVVFDKLKEGWDEGPYHNLERTALLTDIKY